MKVRNTIALLTVAVFLTTSFEPALYAQDTPGSASKATVDKSTIERETPSLSLKEIMARAEKNIQKVNDEMGARRKEEEAKQSFDEGNRLHQAGDAAGAKAAWQKALDISKDPSMKEHIKKTEKEAAEKRRQQEALEREKQKNEEARQRELKKQQKAKEKELAAEKRAQEMAAKDARRQAELAQKRKDKELAKQKSAQEKAARDAQKAVKKKATTAEKKDIAPPAPTAVTTPTTAGSDEISALYNEALKMYQNKDYAGALEKFKQVKDENPSYSRVNFYINSCEYILKNEIK